MPTKTATKPRYFHWANLAIVITALGVLVVTGAWNRPIWLDEFLHFALGGMTFSEVLRTIDYTSIEINHGQTGIYMLVDWGLLQVFGANAVALRSPSLLAALLLMFSAVVFLRNRGLNKFWQWLVLVSLAGNELWAEYVAEARPYMPLAASGVSMITYYAATPDQRMTWPVRLAGFAGLVIGAAFHPYWIYFLFVAIAFGVILAWGDGAWSFRARSLWRYSGGLLLVASILVFITIGQLTWMRRVREFAYDPFEWFESPSAALASLANQHIYGHFLLLWIILFVLTSAALIRRPFGRQARIFTPPIVLIIFGIGGSVAVSLVSAIRGYWIFERQWVGGVAIAVVAFVWLFGLLWHQSSASTLQWRRWPSVMFALIVLLGAISTIQDSIEMRSSWHQQQLAFQGEMRAPVALLADLGDESSIYAANINITRGGPVWRELLAWYNNQAGMRPEFRETNPSWTHFFFGD